MRYLRAKCTFIKQTFINVDISRLNARTLFKLFKQGESCNYRYNLQNKTYCNKTNYEKLPRCIRYDITERYFEDVTFASVDFYPLNTPEHEIIIDYCQRILYMIPQHKKTLKIIKEIQDEYPELFI